MKVFTYSQARQALAKVLDAARKEPVLISRRGGDMFVVTYAKATKSPFDVPGVRAKAATADILDAVRASRARSAKEAEPGRRQGIQLRQRNWHATAPIWARNEGP